MKLYEISTLDGEIVEPAILIKEASELLNRTVGTLYQVAAEGRSVDGKYRIRPVDVALSRTADFKMLLEFDNIRLRLLRAKK